MSGRIESIASIELGDVLAGLIRNGLAFNVTRNGDGTWNVQLTGGY